MEPWEVLLFAVRSPGIDYPAYLCVDGSTSTFAEGTSITTPFDIYNPNALKVASFSITNYGVLNVHSITAGNVYASNDDVTYTF